MVNYVLDTIVIPAGNSLAIIIIAVLMYLLFESFKQRKSMSLKMKVSSLLVLVGIIVYDIATIINKSFIPRHHCVIRQIMYQIPFCSYRAAMYYFFIIRMEVTFAGSEVQFSTTLIKALKIIVIIVYTTYALFNAMFAYKATYIEERNICLSIDFNDRDAGFYVMMFGNAIFLVTDLMLGIVLCGAYLKRLWTLYQEMKAMAALSEYNAGVPSNGFKYLVIKQAKLAYIAYISTIVIVGLAPPLGLVGFGWLDSIINALSVFCAFNFAFNRKIYQVLCNCNGSKWAQYVCFCFCCGCCCYASGSEVNGKVDDETRTNNDGSNANSSGLPHSDMSSDPSNDDAIENTIETDINIVV